MIRLAVPGDRPVVERIVEAAYRPWAELIGVRPKPMDDDYAARIAAGHVHLLLEEEGVAGLIVLVPEDGVLLVNNVAVAPDRHGQGLGRALVAAEAQARTAGLGALRLYTNALDGAEHRAVQGASATRSPNAAGPGHVMWSS